MSWPDYRLHRRRRPRWGLVLLLGIAAGVLFAAAQNNWWGFSLLPPGRAASPVTPEPGAAFPTLPAVTAPAVAPAPTVPGSTVTALPVAPLEVGGVAPAFVLPDLFDAGTMHALASYQGRPIILNFWASWCAPCRREMPALQRAATRYRDEGLLVLGMNQTYIDSLDAARRFVDDLALTFPSTRDDSGRVSERLYRIAGLPTSVFITAEGNVAHIQIGEMSEEQVETFSRRLLAGDALQPAP